MKTCPRCFILKSSNEFYQCKTHKDGLSGWCKKCVTSSKRTERNANKEKYKLLDHDRYLNRRKEWLEFFIKHYGEEPQCQICDKKLTWQSKTKGNSHDVVNWDHKQHNNVDVPSGWLYNHNCNNKNQLIWLSFDFGVLCGSCNQFLPTDNRVDWLEKALQYTKDNNGIRV